MKAARCKIKGSDYVGVFVSASERYAFVGLGVPASSKSIVQDTLGVPVKEINISSSDLIGLFSKCNSNGIVLSSLVMDEELDAIKRLDLGVNVGVIKSDLDAVGNNILANDKVAIVNPEYDDISAKQIGDLLGVEVIRAHVGGFKTVGANNLLTNKGLVINNRAADPEKSHLDNITGFDSVRTTANTGSVSVGLCGVANSHGVIVGDNTTGFELERVLEALEE